MAAGEQRWRELANRIATEAGFDLEDLAVVNAGRRRLVRVIIDSDDGVDLNAAAAVSRALSDAMDADEQGGAGQGADERGGAGQDEPSYTLEVTSPGVGRPLTEPRHFHRARTRLIAVTTAAGEQLTGRVVGITGSGVDLLTGRNGTEPRHLPFDQITKAKVEVEFSGPSKAVAALLAADPRSADLLAADRGSTPDDAAPGDAAPKLTAPKHTAPNHRAPNDSAPATGSQETL